MSSSPAETKRRWLSVARECSDKFHVQAEVVPADLSSPESTDQLIAAIVAQPRRLRGARQQRRLRDPRRIRHRRTSRAEVELLNVQLTAALKLTKAVLPAMVAEAQRTDPQCCVGLFLCAGSVSIGLQRVQGIPAFVLRGNSERTRRNGVTVTVFCPGITQTEFRSRAGIGEKNKRSGMTAEAAARIAYVETMRGKPVVIPGMANRMFVLLAKLLPNSSFTGIIRYINRKRGHKSS